MTLFLSDGPVTRTPITDWLGARLNNYQESMKQAVRIFDELGMAAEVEHCLAIMPLT